MPHLDEQPVRALLERHFRLLRHDVVGPVAAAVSGFAGGGGLRQLQQQVRGCQRETRNASTCP
jgi:hypothetical protein